MSNEFQQDKIVESAVTGDDAIDPLPDVDEAETIIRIAGEFTKEASQAARQICFAGLAVVWLFKLTTGVNFALPTALFAPTLLLLLGLGLDFVYWAGGALLWRMDYRFFQGGTGLTPGQRRLRSAILKIDKVGSAEVRTFAPTSILFWGTIGATAVGWLALLAFLANRIFFAAA